MAANKTRPTSASVTSFIAAVENETRRRDARTILAMMKRISGTGPRMWGPTIIGFGTERYRTAAGREGDMPRMAFSPRKASLVLYLLYGKRVADLRKRLGKHTIGVSCLYINTLADVDLAVLEEMMVRTWNPSTPR
jgi:hypothetical protein